MKIEITSEKVTEQSGMGKNGKPYNIAKQAAYVYMPDSDGVICKQRIELQLDNANSPYKVGQYQLSDSSFVVGDFGQLRIGRIRLGALLQAQPKAA
jgi:hypothetical protein